MSISTHHEILIKRLSSFVHQIDIALRASLVTKIQLPDFRTNMRARYLQPADVTDPASCPVTEREDCSSTPVSPLHDQRAQYRALRTLHEDGNSLSERQV